MTLHQGAGGVSIHAPLASTKSKVFQPSVNHFSCLVEDSAPIFTTSLQRTLQWTSASHADLTLFPFLYYKGIPSFPF